MKPSSRTEYSMKNASVAMYARLIAVFAGFLTRVTLTHMLNSDYVGINGLFTGILGALTLSELGVDTALVYALYRPGAADDRQKQKDLLKLYSRIYRKIALAVLAIGVVMYPILRVLIRQEPDVDHLLAIYFLYVANTVSTYFLAHRGMLFLAHQENYLNNYFTTAFLLIQNALQIVLLLTTRDYVLFLLVQIGCNLARNAVSFRYAGRRYPFLRELQAYPVEKKEKKEIFRNTRAMFVHKIGLVIINNTDNFCLTFFSGLISVGIYANYYLIIGSIRQIADNVVRGVAGSVGNLAASEDSSRVHRVFRTTLFVVNWLYGFCTICLFALLDLFVGVAFGSHYVFPETVTAVLCLNFYLNGMRQAVLIFRDSLGLFWYDRYKTVAESLVNLGLSILLAHFIGTLGVFIGTTVSIVSVSLWVEPMVLYHRYLKQKMGEYFRLLAVYVCVTALSAAVTVFCCNAVTLSSSVTEIFVRLVICLAVSNAVYALCFFRTGEFRKVLRTLRAWIRKK